mmetsp:Transcript_39203/g.79190  ORF Transcript_39203/g.79190 Transcript_39203/m.79190 type:complete len:231 (+) Transcript_39203:62-754(+)
MCLLFICGESDLIYFRIWHLRRINRSLSVSSIVIDRDAAAQLCDEERHGLQGHRRERNRLHPIPRPVLHRRHRRCQRRLVEEEAAAAVQKRAPAGGGGGSGWRRKERCCGRCCDQASQQRHRLRGKRVYLSQVKLRRPLLVGRPAATPVAAAAFFAHLPPVQSPPRNHAAVAVAVARGWVASSGGRFHFLLPPFLPFLPFLPFFRRRSASKLELAPPRQLPRGQEGLVPF